MAFVCNGCKQQLKNNEKLICAYCNDIYDLDCANVSLKRYLNVMTREHKKSWKCQACRCKTPKTGNKDTPIRPQEEDRSVSINQMQSAIPDAIPDMNMNVTTRNKLKSTNCESICSEDLSLLDDTLYSKSDSKSETSLENILQKLSDIITQRLKENNKTIIEDLQNTIQCEINKAILELKDNIYQETNKLQQQNKHNTEKIEQINIRINQLTKENEKLTREINDLKTKHNMLPVTQSLPENDTSKKIVLYGFTEYHKESSAEMHNRLLEVFYDTLNIDLTGYVEDIQRIGKYNMQRPARPLVIELLSKRMTKNIIQNSNYLRGTGLFVSEFLDKLELKNRKAMREAMFASRKDGLHAVIRNNELYVEGQKIDWKNENSVENNIHRNTKDNNQHMSSPNNNHKNRNIQHSTFRNYNQPL